MSSEPLLEENSGLSNPTSSETGYNTASHAGLQSDLSPPSSSSHTALSPLLASKISPSSNNLTIGLYPIRSAPTYAQDLDSQTSSRGQPQLATLTRKTSSASFGETHLTADPTSSKAVDSLFNSSAASNPSKKKERASISGKLNTKFPNKQMFSPDGEVVASGSGNKTVQLRDSATGAACCTLKGHTGAAESVAFSPDGKLVA
jgi:WD40 repeat protein